MQTTTRPEAPPAPAEPPAPPVVTIPGPDGKPQTLTIPKTQAEYDALLSQRRELSEQLSSVSARRAELSEQVQSAPDGASRAGLEERIRLLDQRLLQMEADIGVLGRQMSMAPADLNTSYELDRAGANVDGFDEGLQAGVFFSILGLGVIMAIRHFLRRRRPRRKVEHTTESPQRLERMEQAIEAIAIEVERISEGQRFVTRLLGESQSPVGAVSGGIAEPVAADRGEPPGR